MSDAGKIGKIMEQAPLPLMVGSLLTALANAQTSLTQSAVDAMIKLSDPANGVQLPGESQKQSLLELGLIPSFLFIQEATITARVAFSYSESEETTFGASAGVTYGVFSASVNAGYSSKYSFEASGASEITTKLVTVPPPTEFQERLRLAAAKKAQQSSGTPSGSASGNAAPNTAPSK